ncbi:unnamed protein product [Closterium sp. NIES-53]
MASLYVLTFDHKSHPIQFDTWLDDLQLYLLSNSRDSVSLFNHTSGASLAPPATADIARYSSPATAALGRLLLPYLFPKLSAIATVANLVTHLRSSDACYRAALPAESLDRNPPPMGVPPPPLPPPTPLLLLLTSLVLRTPGLLLLVGSAAAARARVARVVEVAAGVVVGAAVEVVEVVEVVAAVGVVAGVGALVVGVVVAVGVEVVAAVGVVAVRVELFRGEVLAVASGSSISIGARPLRPSSFCWSDCYLYVLPAQGIKATALGASESALPGIAPAEALHTFTLDSGASRCFFSRQHHPHSSLCT